MALQDLRLPRVHTLWQCPNDPEAKAIRLPSLLVSSVCLRSPKTNKHKVQGDKSPHMDMRQVSRRGAYTEMKEKTASLHWNTGYNQIHWSSSA